MVAQPGDDWWSSYGANAEGRCEPWISPHSEYLALGSDPEARAVACRALFAEALPEDFVLEIRSYLQQQKVLGTDRFRAWDEARTGRFSHVDYQGMKHSSPSPMARWLKVSFLAAP
jgi:putative transposase